MGIDWKHGSSDSDCITFPQKLSQQSACCRLRFYKDWTAYILRRRPDALPRRDSNPRREKLARGRRRRKGDEEQDVWFGQSRRHHQNALGRLINRLFSGATSPSCLTILNNVTVYWSRTGGGGWRAHTKQPASRSVSQSEYMQTMFTEEKEYKQRGRSSLYFTWTETDWLDLSHGGAHFFFLTHYSLVWTTTETNGCWTWDGRGDERRNYTNTRAWVKPRSEGEGKRIVLGFLSLCSGVDTEDSLRQDNSGGEFFFAAIEHHHPVRK